jgi:hypothetical protein
VTSAVDGESERVARRTEVFTFHTLIDSRAGTTAKVGCAREPAEEVVGAAHRIFAFADTITPSVDDGE